jgi:teichuronic acid biosynthesis glycosyltransferase TuaC
MVCSGNSVKDGPFIFEKHQVFIFEQAESLKLLGIEFEHFFISGKGLRGYFKSYLSLRRVLKNKYDLIHAHNGFCGFITNLQRKVPVITTYHGSDINVSRLRMISYFPLINSKKNILVSQSQVKKLLIKKNSLIIPCGVNLKIFHPYKKSPLQIRESSIATQTNILFSSSFSNRIKNYKLANESIRLLSPEKINLIELKDKSREEVCSLLNNCNLLLLTSFSEGSPQIIKEAMACNCPIVSTDVGDIRYIIGNTEGCFLTTYNPADVAEKLSLALKFSRTRGRTSGLTRITDLGLTTENVAKQIFDVYCEVCGLSD